MNRILTVLKMFALLIGCLIWSVVVGIFLIVMIVFGQYDGEKPGMDK